MDRHPFGKSRSGGLLSRAKRENSVHFDEAPIESQRALKVRAPFRLSRSRRLGGASAKPGEARLADLLAQHYFAPVSVMTLLGSDLVQAASALAPSDGKLEPELDPASIQPQREYRVALSARQITPFVKLTHLAPHKYEVADGDVAQALTRYGVTGTASSSARVPEVAAGSASGDVRGRQTAAVK